MSEFEVAMLQILGAHQQIISAYEGFAAGGLAFGPHLLSDEISKEYCWSLKRALQSLFSRGYVYRNSDGSVVLTADGARLLEALLNSPDFKEGDCPFCGASRPAWGLPD